MNMSRLSNFPTEKDDGLPEETLDTSTSTPEMTAEDCRGSDRELYQALETIRALLSTAGFCGLPLVTRMKFDTGRMVLVKLEASEGDKITIDCKGIDSKNDDRTLMIMPLSKDASGSKREYQHAYDIGIVKSILRFVREKFSQG